MTTQMRTRTTASTIKRQKVKVVKKIKILEILNDVLPSSVTEKQIISIQQRKDRILNKLNEISKEIDGLIVLMEKN